MRFYCDRKIIYHVLEGPLTVPGALKHVKMNVRHGFGGGGEERKGKVGRVGGWWWWWWWWGTDRRAAGRSRTRLRLHWHHTPAVRDLLLQRRLLCLHAHALGTRGRDLSLVP